jgi:hypothetical protein
MKLVVSLIIIFLFLLPVAVRAQRNKPFEPVPLISDHFHVRIIDPDGTSN